MNENDLISLLNILVKIPSLVKEVKEDGFDTDFGLIEKGCLGSCIKITLLNKSVVSIDITDNKDVINNLLEQVAQNCIEFGVFMLKDRLNKCYDILSNNSDNNRDN